MLSIASRKASRSVEKKHCRVRRKVQGEDEIHETITGSGMSTISIFFRQDVYQPCLREKTPLSKAERNTFYVSMEDNKGDSNKVLTIGIGNHLDPHTDKLCVHSSCEKKEKAEAHRLEERSLEVQN